MANGSPEWLARLREQEAELARQPPSEEVAARLEALRHDIELALADVDAVLRHTRAARAADLRRD